MKQLGNKYDNLKMKHIDSGCWQVPEPEVMSWVQKESCGSVSGICPEGAFYCSASEKENWNSLVDFSYNVLDIASEIVK